MTSRGITLTSWTAPIPKSITSTIDTSAVGLLNRRIRSVKLPKIGGRGVCLMAVGRVGDVDDTKLGTADEPEDNETTEEEPITRPSRQTQKTRTLPF